MIYKWLLSILIVSLFTSCSYRPNSRAYREFYDHLKERTSLPKKMEKSPYFLVILVNARHLDYTDNVSFFRTVARHPDDGSTNGDVGHAWIYLQGIVNGRCFVLEGGHSGERGHIQTRYFDGIMDYNEWGFVNPTPEQKRHPRYEPNPIKYLWSTQQDGFFQKGNGGHTPTFAAKIDLTEEQFRKILAFIYQEYPFSQYAITQHQCSSFAAHVAALGGLNLDYEICVPVRPYVWFRGCWIRFWEDPHYSWITFSSPDILEKSLIKAVKEGRAQNALIWYLNL